MHSLLSFFLADNPIPSWVWVLLPVLAVVFAAAGVVAGICIYRRYRNRKIGSTQAQADSILEFAREEAKSLKNDAIKEAREENQRLKNETERQIKERSGELAKQEIRMSQKEEALDKKEEMLLQKLDQIDVQQKQLIAQQGDLNRRAQELDKSEDKIQKELERVAGLSKDEAKQILVDRMVSDARKDRYDGSPSQ